MCLARFGYDGLIMCLARFGYDGLIMCLARFGYDGLLCVSLDLDMMVYVSR
jgi:hypothetical protein